MMTPRHRTWGAFLAFLAVLAFSPDGLLIRHAQVEQPEPGCMIFTKYAFSTATLAVAMLVRFSGPTGYKEDCKKTGWHFWATALGQGLGDSFYNVGLFYTSVATGVCLGYLTTVWIVLGSILVNREYPPRCTVGAVILALSCSVIIGLGSEPQSQAETGHVLRLGAGIWWSLGAGIMWAMKYAVTRHAALQYRDCDLIGSTVVGSAISMLVGVVMLLLEVHSQPCSPQSGIWGYRWLALDASIILPLGFGLTMLALKYCSATVVGLIMLFDSVSQPFWVWLGTGEMPSRLTLVGGASLLATLAIHETIAICLEEANEDAAANETTPLIIDNDATGKLP